MTKSEFFSQLFTCMFCVHFKECAKPLQMELEAEDGNFDFEENSWEEICKGLYKGFVAPCMREKK